VVQLRATLESVLETEEGAPFLSILEPLFERYDPTEVAAAAVALLRARGASPAGSASPMAAPAADPGATPAWAKLFIGVGERDGLRAGDLLGAITGEAGVDGRSVGKIDIHESHTVVEVHDAVARKVIKALNGTTIRGRAVRADFDRPRRGASPARRPWLATRVRRPPPETLKARPSCDEAGLLIHGADGRAARPFLRTT
jgi:ATP-dependent RNA helicase DeaD